MYSNSQVFKTLTSNNFFHAQQYICGLFQSDKRNMEKLVEKVAQSEYHKIHHFISESPWDAKCGFDRVVKDTNKLFVDFQTVYLVIDESSHTKSGKHSVAVSRQYNGQLGKVDNCQVAVYGALSTHGYYSLIDIQLYIPQDWFNQPTKCKKAGIPLNINEQRTKTQLALKIIKHQTKLGIRFIFVVADGLYGHDSNLRKETDKLGVLYVTV